MSSYLVFWWLCSQEAGVVGWEAVLLVLGEVGRGVRNTARVHDCPADLHNVFHCGKVPIAWNSLTRKEGSVLFNDTF